MSPGRILPAKATRTRRLREGFIEDDGPFGLDSLPYLRLKWGRALTNTPRSSGPGNGVHFTTSRPPRPLPDGRRDGTLGGLQAGRSGASRSPRISLGHRYHEADRKLFHE